MGFVQARDFRYAFALKSTCGGQGGYKSKINLLRANCTGAGLAAIRWKDIGSCSVLVLNASSRCRPSPDPSIECSLVLTLLQAPLPISSTTLWNDAVGCAPCPQQPHFARAISTDDSSIIHVMQQALRHPHSLPSVHRSACLLNFPRFPPEFPLTFSHHNNSDYSTSPQSTMVGLVTPPNLTLDYYTANDLGDPSFICD